MRWLGEDRDRVVRAVYAGSGNASRRGARRLLRFVPRHWFLARGVARGGISLDGKAERRPTGDLEPRPPRLRRRRRPRHPGRHRGDARALHHPLTVRNDSEMTLGTDRKSLFLASGCAQADTLGGRKETFYAFRAPLRSYPSTSGSG